MAVSHDGWRSCRAWSYWKKFCRRHGGGIAFVLDEQKLLPRCATKYGRRRAGRRQQGHYSTQNLDRAAFPIYGKLLAQRILQNWDAMLPKFVKVMPQDYRRALLQLEQEKVMAAQVEQEMAAAQP